MEKTQNRALQIMKTRLVPGGYQAHGSLTGGRAAAVEAKNQGAFF